MSMEQDVDVAMSQRMEQYAQELHDHFMRFWPEDFFCGAGVGTGTGDAPQMTGNNPEMSHKGGS